MIDHAVARGLITLWGDVARDNQPMLAVAAALGFSQGPGSDASRTRIVKDLPGRA